MKEDLKSSLKVSFEDRIAIKMSLRLDIIDPDVVADIRSLPLLGGKIEIVYVSHVLEHFHRSEIHGILNEWIRVLKPGGELRLKVHNLMWSANAILKDYLNENVYAILWGSSDYRMDSHSNAYTDEYIKGLLGQHGLESITTQIEDHENLDMIPSGRGYYLKVTATKPKCEIRPFFGRYKEILRERREISSFRAIDRSTNMGALQEIAEARGQKLKVINLGSGKATVSFDGPRSIRVDLRREVNPDIVADVRSLPFCENYFDIVFSSHTLEHFNREELHGILDEWILVLKPNGMLILQVPNLKWAAREILKGNYDSNVYSVLFAWRGYKGNAHHFGFTEKTIKALLEQNGLEDVVTLLANDYWAEGRPPLKDYHLIAKGRKPSPKSITI